MEISFWKTVGCLIKKRLIMFLRAARRLHPLAVRGAAEPMAHGQRRGSAHGRGLGALGAGVVNHPRYRQAEYLTLVCDNLNTHAYDAFPPAEARRLAQRVRSGVYAPARPLAPQDRTGIERPDAPSPVPAHGDAGRGPRAGGRVGGGPQRRPDGHRLASAPRTPASDSRSCTRQLKHDEVLGRRRLARVGGHRRVSRPSFRPRPDARTLSDPELYPARHANATEATDLVRQEWNPTTDCHLGTAASG